MCSLEIQNSFIPEVVEIIIQLGKHEWMVLNTDDS